MFDTPPILTVAQRNKAMLDALKSRSNLKAVIFVAGRFVGNEDKREYLRVWNQAGHAIVNHTYSHFNYRYPGESKQYEKPKINALGL